MLDHEPVIDTRGRDLLRLDLLDVFALLLKVRELRVIENIRSCTRRAKIRVQAFAAPGGFNEQDRRVCELLHVEGEGELGADFRAVLVRAKARGQLFSVMRWEMPAGCLPCQF